MPQIETMAIRRLLRVWIIWISAWESGSTIVLSFRPWSSFEFPFEFTCSASDWGPLSWNKKKPTKNFKFDHKFMWIGFIKKWLTFSVYQLFGSVPFLLLRSCASDLKGAQGQLEMVWQKLRHAKKKSQWTKDTKTTRLAATRVWAKIKWAVVVEKCSNTETTNQQHATDRCSALMGLYIIWFMIPGATKSSRRNNWS